MKKIQIIFQGNASMEKSQSLILAEQLRRKGQFREALKVVSPLVYQDGKLRPQPGGLAEYALNLAQLGAPESSEGLILTQKQLSQDELFALGMSQILQWKHHEASVHLEMYCENTDNTKYQFCVGIVNLLWCYIYDGAFDKIENTVTKYRSNILQYDVLKINFETIVRKSNLISRLQTGCALNLKIADLPTVSLSPYDALALELSSCLLRCMESNLNVSAILDLETKGNNLGLYEFGRECALWRICLSPEASEHERFFVSGWGTPFQGFINFAHKIVHILNCPTDIFVTEAFIQHNCYLSHVPEAGFLDPWGQHSQLFTKSEQALLRVLVKDRYRPSTLVRLFMESRTDSQYFPDTAPQVVHMMISRLRKKFHTLKIDWTIEANVTYQLLVGATALRVTYNMENRQSNTDHDTLLVLSAFVDNKSETRKNLETKTQLHAKKIIRILATLLQEHKIEQIGKGTSTAYRAVSQLLLGKQ